MPTCLELCGLEIADGLQALSLMRDLPERVARATLKHPWGEVQRAVKRSGATGFLCSLRSVYDGRHQLIRYSDGREELFDLSVDPGALENLSEKRPEVLRRMRDLLAGE